MFALGRSHPLYALFGPRLDPTLRRRYAWYVRVPDLPGFVRHIAPALERRLAVSPAAGYSGALHLDLYRGGLRLALELGRLVAVEQWRVSQGGGPGRLPHASFLATTPGLSRPRRATRHLPRRVDRRRHNRHHLARPVPGPALVGAMPRLAVQQR